MPSDDARFSRHQSRTRHDGQRCSVHLTCSRDRLPRARVASSTHPALPPTHHRQGRALHPNASTRVACGRLFQASTERTTALDPWLTHYNSTRLPRRPQQQAARHTTDQRSSGVSTRACGCGGCAQNAVRPAEVRPHFTIELGALRHVVSSSAFGLSVPVRADIYE